MRDASFPRTPSTLPWVAGLRVLATAGPTGSFDTVRHTKTMVSRGGQLLDEFSRSTPHGVTVERNHWGPGVVATDILQAVK